MNELNDYVEYNGTNYAVIYKEGVWIIFPDVSGRLRKSIKSKAKAKMNEDMIISFNGHTAATYPTFTEKLTFDTCTECVSMALYPTPCNQEQPAQAGTKEPNMATLSTTSDLQTQQKNYAVSRLFDIRSDKVEPLRAAYGLALDSRPTSVKEFKERIASGRYSFPESSKEQEEARTWYEDLWYAIEWRDPSVKKDEKGYNEAHGKMEAAYQAAKDLIVLSSTDTDYTKILSDFEATDFH